MRDVYEAVAIIDRGGRRSGIDRRRLLIPSYSPERRSEQDRRSGLERRSGKDTSWSLLGPRRRVDTYIEFIGTLKGLFWGVSLGSLLWGVMILFIVFVRAS